MNLRFLSILAVALFGFSARTSALTFEWEQFKPENQRTYEARADQLARRGIAAVDAADSLEASLVADGYLDTQTEAMGDTIRVRTGERYRLEALELTSDSTTVIPVREVFTQAGLDTAIARSLRVYQATGYYYARAALTGLRKSAGAVTALINVNPGPMVAVAEVRYVGLTRTKSSLLDRSLPGAAGDTLTEAFIAGLEKSAGQLEYVNFEPPIVIKPRFGYTQADLELHFKEQEQFVFAGGAGYSNDREAGLVWNLSVQMQNLFGEGRQAVVRSERREKGRNLLNVAYSQPSTLVGVGTLRGELSTRDYREQFYEFSLGAGYDLQISPEFSSGLALHWKRVEPQMDKGYGRADVAVSVSRIQLDDPMNPRRGYSFVSSVGYSYRKYSADSIESVASFNDTRATLRGDYFAPMCASVIGHAAVGYRGLETGESLPPVSELILVGGPGTLRGYRNEQFAAKRVVFGTIEPRYRFGAGYLFGFVDAAFMQQPVTAGATADLQELTRYGYGLGVALADNARGVKLSLGWNREVAIDQPWLSVEFTAGL